MSEQQEAPGTVSAVRGPENQLGGGSQLMLPQLADTVQPRAVVARPVLVVTAGRVEYATRCPHCRDWHRHVSLGPKVAPCGQRYELAPRRGRRAA